MVTIELSIQIAAPIQRCFDLARSIEVHLLGTDQSGEEVVDGVKSGLMGPNDFVCWRAKHLGVRQRLTSKITAFDAPVYFQDTMLEGAFKFMQHDHYFHALSPDRCEMKDRFVFSAPVPILGQLVELLFLKRYMVKFLRHRNEVVKQVAESDTWTNFLPHAG